MAALVDCDLPKMPADPVPATIDSTSFDSICRAIDSHGMRPYMMTGILRHVLISHFAASGVIEEPTLRSLLWKDSPDSPILIESVYRWKPAEANKRPACLIRRNGFQQKKLAVGNIAGSTPQMDLKYAVSWVGSHTVFCLGGSSLQAELLGMEVQRELTEFGPLIQKTLGLLKFEVVEVGAAAEVDESAEHYGIPITIGWAYTESWTLKQTARKLGKIQLSTLITL